MPITQFLGGKRRTIFSYAPPGKESLFVEFLLSLTQSNQKKVLSFLERVAENGVPDNPEKHKKLSGTIHEFKLFKIRLLWFFEGERIVITHGFYKKADKTRPQEIVRADRIRAEILEEKKRTTP